MDQLVGLRAKARAKLEEKAANGDSHAQRRMRTNDLKRESLRRLRDGAAAGDTKAQEQLSRQRAYRNQKTRQWQAKDKIRRDANDAEAIARFEQKKVRGRERAAEYAAEKRAAASSALPSKKPHHTRTAVSMTPGREKDSDIRHFFERTTRRTGSGRMSQSPSPGEQDSRSSDGEPKQPADQSSPVTSSIRRSWTVRLPLALRTNAEVNGKVEEPANTISEANKRKKPTTEQHVPFRDHDIETRDAKVVVIDDYSGTRQLSETSATIRLSDGTHVDRERAGIELIRLQTLWKETDLEEQQLVKARRAARSF